VPDGVEWAPFNAAMRARGLIIAGGQGMWAGRILRFGHMGAVGIDEMADALRLMGATLPDFGHAADGEAAAQAAVAAHDAASAVPVAAR
jgi:aspartate aminotransferase-like enzyme